MTLRFLLVLLVLCAPAVLPTFAIVGPRPVAVPLLLPFGSLLAAISAVLAVASRTSMVPWLVVVDVAATAAAAALLLRARQNAPWSRAGEAGGGLSALLVAAGAMLVGLLPLRHTVLDWDARSIWLLHARLLDAGGSTYVHALQSSLFGFSHPDYPPLAPATVAVAWKVGGSAGYRVGQVVLALLGACLLVVAAWLVGRRARGRLAAVSSPVLAGLFAFAALGATTVFLTDGYADVVAAAAATVAALALLAEPATPTFAALGLAAAVMAALTKDEGLVAALLVVALWVARLLRSHRQERRLLAAGVATGVAMVMWPLVVAALGGPAGSAFSAPGPAASTPRGTRLRDAISGVHDLVPMWWLVLGAVVLAGIAVATRPGRDRADPGAADAEGRAAPLGWLAALVVLYLAALVVTYTVGTAPITWWIYTSIFRVTILARLLMYAAAAIAVALVLDTAAASDEVDDDAEGATQKVPVTP